MKTIYSVVALSLITTSLFSAPIADKSGFSGFVSAGISSLNFKSNMVAGNTLNETIEDETIDTLQDKPNNENTTQPNINYNLVYTFADIKTGPFRILCQSGKITNTQGRRYEDRNRRRAICSRY